SGRLWRTRLVVVPGVRREGVVGLRGEVLDPLGRRAGASRLGCAFRRPHRALGRTLPGGERRRLLLGGRGRGGGGLTRRHGRDGIAPPCAGLLRPRRGSRCGRLGCGVTGGMGRSAADGRAGASGRRRAAARRTAAARIPCRGCGARRSGGASAARAGARTTRTGTGSSAGTGTGGTAGAGTGGTAGTWPGV